MVGGDVSFFFLNFGFFWFFLGVFGWGEGGGELELQGDE